MKRSSSLIPSILAGLHLVAQAEPVQIAILPAKVVPEQATTLHLENGIISLKADASHRQEAGTVIAVLNEERTAQEREEMELKLARDEMNLRDEIRKLQVQRSKVEFYLKLSPQEQRYAKPETGADDMPPTPESLRDIDERLALLKREKESSPRIKRENFERNHAKLTLKMPFTGRLQYHFTLPQDTSKPFEFHSLPGRPFASVCDDSAFYITINLSKAELTQLPEKNFSISLSLPEGKVLTGTYSHRKVEQSNSNGGDMLVYFFKLPDSERETAYNMLGSNAKVRLMYDAGENVQYVSKLELITRPEAAECENWEQLIAKIYPDCNIVLIGERNIIIRPRKN